MPLTATVVITTKNRKDDLAKAIASALAQTAAPAILVIDDASTDGTSELVRERFPSVTVDRAPVSRGYIVHRNRAARIATSDIIVSIDDDAVFSTPTIIERTLQEFDHPRIGAVAIPFIDVNNSPREYQRAPASGIHATSTYKGTAHAIRRKLFNELGGYREPLFHQGEEGDLAIRMLNAGYVVRMGTADPIHHFESPRRDWRRMDLYGRRNDVLFAWHNVPFPYLPIHLAGTTLNGLLMGLRVKRLWAMTQGLALGYASIPREFSHRRPVARKCYRLNRMLKKRGAVPLQEIEPLLPPMMQIS